MNKAIVISEDHYNALGVIRSLGINNTPVYLVLTTEDNNTYTNYSRYVSEAFFTGRNEKRIIEALLKIANDSTCLYFVFPLSDFASEIIDKYRTVLSTNNIKCPNMNGNIKQYQNKWIAKEKATECNLRTAKSIIYEIGEQIKWKTFPAIIKPLVSQEGLKSDITIVNNLSELEAALNDFEAKHYSRVLIEEYLTGQEEHMIEVLGYAYNGRVVIGGIIKKIREYPNRRGSTSFAQIVRDHEGLDINSVILFIENSHFEGLFDMEFKYVDGVCYFIECNFRNGAPSYALTQYNCNLPVNWMNGYLGKEQTAINYKDTMYFMCEQTDILNVIKRDASLSKWIGDFLKSKKVFFSMRDIRPVFRYYRLFIRNIFRSKLRG